MVCVLIHGAGNPKERGNTMKKIINKVIEKCIDCPYFVDYGIEISCRNLWKTIEKKDFEIIKKGFPNWCPLKDYNYGSK